MEFQWYKAFSSNNELNTLKYAYNIQFSIFSHFELFKKAAI